MTRVDHHAHHKLVSSWQPSSQYHMRLREAKGAINVTWCPHGGLRRSIICYYTNAKGAINVANSTCHSGWLCSSLTPTLRLANAAPMSGFNTFASTLVKCLYLWRKLAFRN
jgi:hypothetical protein